MSVRDVFGGNYQAYGKPYEGNKVYWFNDPAALSLTYDIQLDSLGNLYAVGLDAAGSLCVSKMFSNGTVIWTKKFYNGVILPNGSPTIAVDSLDNCYVFFSNWQPYGSGATQIDFPVIIKYDANGNIVWKKFLINDWEDKLVCNCICDSADNIYVLYQTKTGSLDSSTLVKFDTDGDLLWQKTYYDIVFPITAKHLAISNDVLVVLANTNSGPAVIKINTSGSVTSSLYLASNTINDSLQFTAEKICADNFSNLYVSGTWTNPTTFQTSILVYKINSSNSVSWSQVIKYNASNSDIGAAICQHEGYIYVGGNDTSGFSNSLTVIDDLGTLQYGRLVNAATYDYPIKNIVVDSISNIFAASAGSLYKLPADGSKTGFYEGCWWTEPVYLSVDDVYLPGPYSLPVSVINSSYTFVSDIYNDSFTKTMLDSTHWVSTSFIHKNYWSGFETDGMPEIGLDVVVDSSGNSYTLNVSGSESGSLYPYLILIKYNSAGEIVWIRRQINFFTGVRNPERSIHLDSQGNLIIIGYTVSKWSADGDLLWHRFSDANATSFPAEDMFVTCGAVDLNDNVIVCTYDAIIKHNSEGTLIWARTIDTDSGKPAFVSIAVDSNDNIYATARSKHLLTTGGRTYYADFGHIIKYSSAGDLLWSRELFTDTVLTTTTSLYYTYIFPGDITIDKYDRVWVVGDYLTSQRGSTSIYDGFMFVVCCSSDGISLSYTQVASLSNMAFPYTDSSRAYSYGIATTSSADDVYVVQTRYYWSIDEIGFYYYGYNPARYIRVPANIFKISSTGNVLWQSEFAKLSADIRPLYSGICVDSNSVYITGIGYDSLNEYRGATLIKIPSNGTLTGTYGNWSYNSTYYGTSYSSSSSVLVGGSIIIAGSPYTYTPTGSSYMEVGPFIGIEDTQITSDSYLTYLLKSGIGTSLHWYTTLSYFGGNFSGVTGCRTTANNTFITMPYTTPLQSRTALAKYDTKGTLVFQTEIQTNMGTIQNLHADQNNNIYLNSSYNIAKFDGEGNLIWSKQNDITDFIGAKVNNSGLIGLGSYSNNGASVMQLSTNGSINWQKELVFDVVDYNYWRWTYSEHSTIDQFGGVTALTYMEDESRGYQYTTQSGYTYNVAAYGVGIVKFNNSGSLLWQRSIWTGIDNSSVRPRDIASDSNNNVICALQIDDPYRLLILKINGTTGNIMWQREICLVDTTTSSYFNPANIALDTNNNIYIAVKFDGIAGPSIIKLSASGSILWEGSILSLEQKIIGSSIDIACGTNGYMSIIAAGRGHATTFSIPIGGVDYKIYDDWLIASTSYLQLTPSNYTLETASLLSVSDMSSSMSDYTLTVVAPPGPCDYHTISIT